MLKDVASCWRLDKLLDGFSVVQHVETMGGGGVGGGKDSHMKGVGMLVISRWSVN